MAIPSVAIALEPVTMSIDSLEKRLRNYVIPVITRIEKEKIVCDMRTILPDDESGLIAAIISVLKNAP